METQIRKITIVVAQGVKTYSVGDDLYGHVIHKIGVVSLHFQGDPFDHYVGYSKEGEMLFSVNCLCPCDVEYFGKDNTHI